MGMKVPSDKGNRRTTGRMGMNGGTKVECEDSDKNSPAKGTPTKQFKALAFESGIRGHTLITLACFWLFSTNY